MQIHPATVPTQGESVDENIRRLKARLTTHVDLLTNPQAHADSLNDLYSQLFGEATYHPVTSLISRPQAEAFIHLARCYWLNQTNDGVTAVGRLNLNWLPIKVNLKGIGWVRAHAPEDIVYAALLGVTDDMAWVYVTDDPIDSNIEYTPQERPTGEFLTGPAKGYPIITSRMHDDVDQRWGHIHDVDQVYYELFTPTIKQLMHAYYELDYWIIPITAEWERVARNSFSLITSEQWELLDNPFSPVPSYLLTDRHHRIAQALVFATRWCGVSRIADQLWEQPTATFLALFWASAKFQSFIGLETIRNSSDANGVVDAVLWWFHREFLSSHGTPHRLNFDLVSRSRSDVDHLKALKAIDFEHFTLRCLNLKVDYSPLEDEDLTEPTFDN